MRRNSGGISSGAARIVRGWRGIGGAVVAVGCAAFATAADNWTGVIRCEIDVSAAGYSHRETSLRRRRRVIYFLTGSSGRVPFASGVLRGRLWPFRAFSEKL